MACFFANKENLRIFEKIPCFGAKLPISAFVETKQFVVGLLLKYGNNIAVDPHTEKTRRCHVDRSGDISFAVVRDSSSLYF